MNIFVCSAMISAHRNAFYIFGFADNCPTVTKTKHILSRIKTKTGKIVITSINFILLIDGSPYTSPQFKDKINRAAAEGNAYFNMSVPIVEINTSDIRPYVDKELFKPQEEYATNVPTAQLDSIVEIVKHVDWICQKTEIEQPLRDGNGDLGAFLTKDEIVGSVSLDDIIAGSNKPPKIRWRQRKNRR